MKYIESLREGERISEIYLCKFKQTALTKAGKPYENVILQDKTGTLDAKIWDVGSIGIDEFDALDYVQVNGDVTSFQGALQLNIKRVRVAQEGEFDPTEYLPISDKDIPQMYAELLDFVRSIKNPYLRQLAGSFFEDEEFAKRFQFHSAAKSVHHGFVGGLLEHTLAVTSMCDYYTTYYPILNRDLLLTAAMLHDIGKVYELSTFPENDYTDSGQLLGHIVMGTMMIRDKIRDSVPEFPAKEANELEHCILAHHGELEYGSPKKPALIEALALSFADNTDAKIQTFMEALDSKDETGWLGYNKMIESNIRRSTK